MNKNPIRSDKKYARKGITTNNDLKEVQIFLGAPSARIFTLKTITFSSKSENLRSGRFVSFFFLQFNCRKNCRNNCRKNCRKKIMKKKGLIRNPFLDHIHFENRCLGSYRKIFAHAAIPANSP